MIIPDSGKYSSLCKIFPVHSSKLTAADGLFLRIYDTAERDWALAYWFGNFRTLKGKAGCQHGRAGNQWNPDRHGAKTIRLNLALPLLTRNEITQGNRQEEDTAGHHKVSNSNAQETQKRGAEPEKGHRNDGCGTDGLQNNRSSPRLVHFLGK